MKIASLGDLHLRNTIPKSRKKADYLEEMWKKMRFISCYCEDNNVELILQPGDFFHAPKQPLEVMIPLAQLIKETDKFVTKIEWITILGQHDLLYHTKSSAFISVNLLAKAGLVRIVDEKPLYYHDGESKGIYVYGCSYGDGIPEILNPEAINILLIHAMIIKDKKIWEKQDNFLYSQHLLKEQKFDLIVAGDNHNFFQDHYRARSLVNCGSMMRSNIDQQDHKPCFFIYNTSDKSLTKVAIPIKKDVFIIEQKQETTDDFNDLFSSVLNENQEDVSIDFKKNVEKDLVMAGLDKETETIIREVVYAE